MSQSSGSSSYENVASPFCGLLCDDLHVTNDNATIQVIKSRCGATAGFERSLPDAKPQISGREVSLEEAVTAAAGLVSKSNAPLYGGLSTDIDGIRAALALADHTRGVIDHAYGSVIDRNMAVLQSAGWFMSTLTETRNRADIIVIAGSDVHKLYSCFFNNIVNARESLFSDIPTKRTVVFIGEGLDQSGAVGERIGEVITLACPLDRIDTVLSVLLARLRDHPVRGDEIEGVPLSDIEALRKRFLEASYGVMVWASGDLKTQQPDLTVHTMSEVVKKLNETTRWGGLSLGGTEGSVNATAVCGWQTGYPSQISFANGAPDYDPYLYSIDRQLADKEGDLLVWIASITPDLCPPETDLPMIVLGTPGLKLGKQPDVFIPVGTPGVDHAGQTIRCDSVVSLPLRNLGRSSAPSVAQVLSAIKASL